MIHLGPRSYPPRSKTEKTIVIKYSILLEQSFFCFNCCYNVGGEVAHMLGFLKGTRMILKMGKNLQYIKI